MSNGWPVTDAHLRAPVLWPSAIYCAGANYRDHAAEMARVLNRPHDPNADRGLPWHFLKATRCVADPGATVHAAWYSRKLDWEVELAAIIGRTAKQVSVGNALDYVAGYTAANDLSARELGRRQNLDPRSPFAHDWTLQKSFDGSCPLGPWIVPASEIPDPQNLKLKLWVNDVIKQDSTTGEMIFTVAEQIAQLSRGMTLYPGDVILTGTPAGVGSGAQRIPQIRRHRPHRNRTHRPPDNDDRIDIPLRFTGRQSHGPMSASPLSGGAHFALRKVRVGVWWKFPAPPRVKTPLLRRLSE